MQPPTLWLNVLYSKLTHFIQCSGLLFNILSQLIWGKKPECLEKTPIVKLGIINPTDVPDGSGQQLRMAIGTPNAEAQWANYLDNLTTHPMSGGGLAV